MVLPGRLHIIIYKFRSTGGTILYGKLIIEHFVKYGEIVKHYETISIRNYIRKTTVLTVKSILKIGSRFIYPTLVLTGCSHRLVAK
jgi:hypothetical protein